MISYEVRLNGKHYGEYAHRKALDIARALADKQNSVQVVENDDEKHTSKVIKHYFCGTVFKK